jgi:hypothetical protein
MHTNVCAGIEPVTSCVVGVYSHHYAISAVNLNFIVKLAIPVTLSEYYT